MRSPRVAATWKTAPPSQPRWPGAWGELRFETRDGRPIVPPPPGIDPTSGGTAHLRRLAKGQGHRIDGMTPMALDGGQPPDYGLAIEMLIHNDNPRQARAGPSPP